MQLSDVIRFEETRLGQGVIPLSSEFSDCIKGISENTGNILLQAMAEDSCLYHRFYGLDNDPQDYFALQLDRSSGKYICEHQSIKNGQIETLQTLSNTDVLAFRDDVYPLLLELNFRGVTPRISRTISVDGTKYTAAGHGADQNLIGAALNGDVLTVEKALMSGADPNAKDHNDVSALKFACAHSHTDIVKLLIDAGADVNFRDNASSSALHSAAGKGESEIVYLLLQAGAEVNTSDKNGDTPLMSAAFAGSEIATQILLNAGADVAAKHSNGMTALDVAHMQKKPEIINLLRDAKKIKSQGKTHNHDTSAKTNFVGAVVLIIIILILAAIFS